ncbi:invasion protein IalB [Streptomyces afghaniensis]|nr:invasion protein IalB [Streptomyces afghaniensis]
MLTPTPMRAVSSGSPAAASEPKVTSNTTAAIATPITSAVPPGPALSPSALPPASTVSPESRAWSMACSRCARLASVRSSDPTL